MDKLQLINITRIYEPLKIVVPYVHKIYSSLGMLHFIFMYHLSIRWRCMYNKH